MFGNQGHFARATLAVSLVTALLWPGVASATVGAVFSTAVPQVAVGASDLVRVRGDYFGCNAIGIKDLCRVHPDICARPDINARVKMLTKHRRLAYAGYTSGGLSAVGGVILGAWLAIHQHPGAGIAVYSGLGLGAALAIAGGVIMPRSEDYTRVAEMVLSSGDRKALSRAQESGAGRTLGAVSWAFAF